MSDPDLNIAAQFDQSARQYGDRVAVVVPQLDANLQLVGELEYSFSDIHRLAARYRTGLRQQGFSKGDRIIILLPITVEIFALMMAIWSLGMVAVFLDPGIGLRKIIVALQDSRARAIVSIDKLLKYRWFIPPLWWKRKYSGDSKGLFLRSLDELKANHPEPFVCETLREDDHVLITYTGGSTGRAKGANRNARNTACQFQIISASWAFGDSEVDFPSFPMFGLLNLCRGVKTVLPAVDFARVGEQNSAVIVDQIQRHHATRMSGAPRFMGKLTDYAFGQGIVLESVRHIVLGGATITREFCRRMMTVFPNADIKMVYGSTEVAPIAFINMEELVEAEGQGGIVGRPIPELTVKIVKLPDEIPAFDQRGVTPYVLPDGEPGEIIIRGPHVVQGYVESPQADAATKIIDVDGERWHRPGDVGYFDPQGRLWLAGRLSDLIRLGDRTLYPYIIEQQIDARPDIRRSAIIGGRGARDLHLVIEPESSFDEQALQPLLKTLGLSSASLHVVQQMPVDDRHNSKIDRITLRARICGKA